MKVGAQESVLGGERLRELRFFSFEEVSEEPKGDITNE